MTPALPAPHATRDQARTIRLLRACFGIGAALDAAVVIPMLLPAVAELQFGVTGLDTNDHYRFAMGLAASLMTGWTALLVWGFQHPLERHTILALTAVPVIAGLWLSEAYAIALDLIEATRLAPLMILQLGLVALFLYAHVQARQLVRRSANRP